MTRSRFAIAAALCFAVFVAGCATEVPKHGKFEETEFYPDGSVKKKTVAGSDYSMYLEATKVSAPVAKVKLPAPGGGEYAVEIPMVSSGQQQAIAPPVQEKGFLEAVLDRGERWLGFGLQAYGINRGAAVQMRMSDNQRDERVAGIKGYVEMGSQNTAIATQGFVTLGQVPRVNNINVGGNALLGDGNLNVNSGNTTRTCTGGQGANGGNGAGTTTGASGATGGAGGPASC